jgi:Protein of unknown function (DUF2877)
MLALHGGDRDVLQFARRAGLECAVRICALGWRADVALRASAGEARVLAALSASVYVETGGELLWIGAPDATLHARVMHVAEASAVAASAKTGERLRLPRATGLHPWRPDATPATAAGATAMCHGAARLRTAAKELGEPRGFGGWLLGIPLAFPLEPARARADELAAACAADDAARAADAAAMLVGLGPGLTPAGDDFSGGAFFARALLARAGAIDSDAWCAAAAAVKTTAGRLTHPIGATLLGDLLLGEGWAPLHDLANGLANGNEAVAFDAARQLVGLGHSSGWDVLAGFVAGARLTAPDVQRRGREEDTLWRCRAGGW